MRAAIGLAQLEKLDAILERRAPSPRATAELLSGIDGLELPCADDADHERSWFVYVVALPPGTDREGVIAALDAQGVADRPLPPVHPPAAVHARAVRVPGGALPGRRGGERAHARASVPRAPRGGRPGVRGRGARLGARRRASSRSAWGTRADRSQGEGRSRGRRGGGARGPRRPRRARRPRHVLGRVDPSELYSVTRTGVAGGLGRALVQLDFPHVAGARSRSRSWRGKSRDRRSRARRRCLVRLRRRAWLVGAPAIALCAVFAWPGVVDADDLDPKPRERAIPAVGVVLAAGLTVAGRAAGRRPASPRAGRATACGSPSRSGSSSCRCPGSPPRPGSTSRRRVPHGRALRRARRGA